MDRLRSAHRVASCFLPNLSQDGFRLLIMGPAPLAPSTQPRRSINLSAMSCSMALFSCGKSTLINPPLEPPGPEVNLSCPIRPVGFATASFHSYLVLRKVSSEV